ncbi:hypothetical protein FKW77_002278 [Venturia effusa]|uniref:Uncharacterized protein n=1 Tax=Venturia effusa TaxID=50376 RepID=A0A517LF48_9PEZI|nr:hypothetical protein FKW77_002278 [Venturia effusa]
MDTDRSSQTVLLPRDPETDKLPRYPRASLQLSLCTTSRGPHYELPVSSTRSCVSSVFDFTGNFNLMAFTLVAAKMATKSFPPSTTVAAPSIALLSSPSQSPTQSQSTILSSSPVVEQSAASEHIPAVLPTEEPEKPQLDVAASVQRALSTEVLKASSINRLVRYERGELLALRHSPHVCTPNNFIEIASEIKSMTDSRKLELQNGGPLSSTRLKKSKIAPTKTKVLKIIKSTAVSSDHPTCAKGLASQSDSSTAMGDLSPSDRNDPYTEPRVSSAIKANCPLLQTSSVVEEDARHEGEDKDEEEEDDDDKMKRIIAEMEAAETEQTARLKEKKRAAKAAVKGHDGDSTDTDLFAILKKNTEFGPTVAATSSGSSTPQSELSGLSVLPMGTPQPQIVGSRDVPATVFYCGRCKQDFKSSTHLHLHFEMSAAHNMCDVCKEDVDSWGKLLHHHKTTGHAIVCQDCYGGNGTVFPADGVAYRAHFNDPYPYDIAFGMPKPLFRAFAGLPKAQSEGTGDVAFLEFLEKDVSTDSTNRYQTINVVGPHKSWSLEELRYGDYEKGRKYGPILPPQPAAAQTLVSPPSLQTPQLSTPTATSHVAGYLRHECWGCAINFPYWSATLHHLESGNCSSGLSIRDLYVSVAKYKNSTHFMEKLQRYHAQEGQGFDAPAFFCPGCKTAKTTLGGLFNHFETSGCYYTVDHPPMPFFRSSMAARLGKFKAESASS